MLPELARLKRTAVDLLFPCYCINCGKEGSLICLSCRNDLPRILQPVCTFCGAAKPLDTPCTNCPGFQPVMDGIRSPFRYETTIRSAIHQLKYKNLRAIATPLANMMADYLADNPIPFEIIIPVPLHPKRLRERGYNQSELLSKELGKRTGIPVETKFLIRHKYTSAQAMTTSATERRYNMTNAFTCCNRLDNRKILLIDDVATSGATLDACASALRKAGAGEVWGLTLARDIL